MTKAQSYMVFTQTTTRLLVNVFWIDLCFHRQCRLHSDSFHQKTQTLKQTGPLSCIYKNLEQHAQGFFSLPACTDTLQSQVELDAKNTGYLKIKESLNKKWDFILSTRK